MGAVERDRNNKEGVSKGGVWAREWMEVVWGHDRHGGCKQVGVARPGHLGGAGIQVARQQQVHPTAVVPPHPTTWQLQLPPAARPGTQLQLPRCSCSRAHLTEQGEGLEGDEHNHEIVNFVGVGPPADHHHRPQHAHHRENDKHGLHGGVGRRE